MDKREAFKAGLLALGLLVSVPALVMAPAVEARGKPGGGGDDGGSTGGKGGGKKGGGTTTTTCVTPYYVADSYSGRATSLDVTATLLGVNITPLKLSDAQLTAPASVAQAGFELGQDLSPLLKISAGLFNSGVVGELNTTVASTNVVGADISVLNGLTTVLRVEAGVLRATSIAMRSEAASCSAQITESVNGATPTVKTVGGVLSGYGSPSYTASSYIASVRITFPTLLGVNPVEIPVSTPPNTTIQVMQDVLLGKLPVATIHVNEQLTTPSGAIDVRALRINIGEDSVLANILQTNIIISRAVADITQANPPCVAGVATCKVTTTPPPQVCTTADFVTGGGYVTLTGGKKGNFGFNGGGRPNGLRGHLNYQDHRSSPPLKISGSNLFPYEAPDATTRVLTFDGGTQLTVTDLGNPGAGGNGVDKFGLLSGGNTYVNVGTTITHGNIQLHKAKSCHYQY